MQAPRFWARPPDDPGFRARLLGPVARLYHLIARRRWRRARPWRAPLPVICVGNLTVGGTGKTPTVAKIVELLTGAGKTPHVVTRGYGGRERGPRRVDISTDTARMVGDEPLILAALAPTWVARDRALGARAAVADGADVIVLDDGHQNPGLYKDLSIIVIDAEAGFGNGRLLPAGPLREPIGEGLARAHMIVSIGEGDPPTTPPGIPLFKAGLRPRPTGAGLMGTPVIAFAGIGRPEKFFDTVRALGARIVRTVPFPDHHQYRAHMLNRLAKEAARARATLVTTEKDAARFPRWFQGRAVVIPVELHFSDGDAFSRAVLAAVNHN